MKYKAVLWDFGGVLTESPFKSINILEVEKKIPLNSIRKINSTNPNKNAWALLERGEISLKTFDLLFEEEAVQLGVNNLKGSDVLKCLYGKIRPQMLHSLKYISKHYQCGCLTNNIPDIEKLIPKNKDRKEIKEVLKVFDFIIESRVEKIRKPEKEIYILAMQKFKVKAEEIIYLDDLGINLKPARKLGMTTIKVGQPEKAIKTLEKLLNITII